MSCCPPHESAFSLFPIWDHPVRQGRHSRYLRDEKGGGEKKKGEEESPGRGVIVYYRVSIVSANKFSLPPIFSPLSCDDLNNQAADQRPVKISLARLGGVRRSLG
jgi:hypothetical protein